MLCAKICACLPTWAGAGERKFTSLDSRNLTDTSQPLQMTKGFPTNRESGEKCPSIAIDDGPREPSRGDESSVAQSVSPARSNCWKISIFPVSIKLTTQVSCICGPAPSLASEIQ